MVIPGKSQPLLSVFNSEGNNILLKQEGAMPRVSSPWSQTTTGTSVFDSFCICGSFHPLILLQFCFLALSYHVPPCDKAQRVALCLLVLIQTDKLQANRDTVFFRDGARRIDFVLSYIDDKDGEKKQVRGSDAFL